MTAPRFAACQVVASLNLRTGGPAVSVPALASRLPAHGFESWIATLDYPGLGPMAQAPRARTVAEGISPLGRRLRGWSPALSRKLRSLARTRVDIVHNHGLWMHPNVAARKAAAQACVPLVVSPRGMLEAWSMQFGAAKKRLAWMAYEGANLRAAAAFHATSPEEAESIRRAGLRAPVAMVPNGIDMAEFAAPPPREVLEGRFPDLRGRRWVLFLSRLHPKKGADILVEAWCRVAKEFPDAHLVLAGVDEARIGDGLRSALAAGDCADRATLAGALEGDEKRAALAHATVFALPSASENFGIAVAEALACGVPAISTRGTPWRELETERCGWWIERSVDAVAASLREALAMPEVDRLAMGARGARLIAGRYSLDEGAARMAAFYRWILGCGERPECVVD